MIPIQGLNFYALDCKQKFTAMANSYFGEIKLIGISLGRKTSNLDGQSGIDCGNLWQKFEMENCFEKIPNKISDEVLAVYHEYEGDHTKPYSYFIGCRVDHNTAAPAGMQSLEIPKAEYRKIIAKGIMPGCVANAWINIWSSNIQRAYQADFEIYDKRSKDWNDAEVDIYIGVK